MSRDGRGTPGRIVLKNQTKLKLADVLRRRKTNLRAFIDSLGLTTYASLNIMCVRLGVAPPSESEFDLARPPTERVNSPQEGIIVLEAPPVIDEISGQCIDPDAPVEPGLVVIFGDEPPTEGPQKKTRKKKENLSDDS